MLERLTEWAWSWPTIGLFLVTGLWFSVRTGFFQIFGLCQWWRGTAGQMCRRGGGTGGLNTSKRYNFSPVFKVSSDFSKVEEVTNWDED